ncbi:hypothetical protein [Oleiharenicola lentus]|uniref:hypothetical protein n=1 Tax=Oleiharenicola lentus TaxID=2508720 RepID=UPI003F6614EF
MSKLNFSREDFRQSCLAFDAIGAAATLGDSVAPDEEHAAGAVDAFIRSGCAAVRRPDQKMLAARDKLVAQVRAYVAGTAEVLAKFDEHVANARLVETSFHDIVATLDSFEIAKQPAPERVWACIKMATDELNAAIQLHEEQQKTGDVTILKNPSIDAGDGRTVSLDAVVWSLTRGLGQNLQMLGYSEKWFDTKTGELVIPVPVAIDDNLASQAGLLFVMELAWTDLVAGWDRVRLFDNDVKRERRALPFENRPGPVEVDVLEFGMPTRWELFDAVAVSRLEQNLMQHLMDLAIYTDANEAIKSLSDNAVGLPGPGAFISHGELIAFYFFEQVMFLPVRENKDHAGGLSLRHWLRGYAYLAELCRDEGNPAVDVKFYALLDLVTGLMRCGFTDAEANMFIRHVTYGRKSRDLMDDPLVRLSDDRLFMFAPAFRSPMLTTIVMSRLGRFSVGFADKGKRFEAAVKKQFEEAGVPAKTFKYKIEDVQYDCDVGVLWGRTLFVFECKNHSLAFGHLPSLSDFVEEYFYAAQQAARTKEFLEENPEVAKQHFGHTAAWDRIVAVVLYAAPWSTGRILKDHELYSYDASALGKFLREGKVSIQTPRQHGNATVVRRHQHQLWKGDKPDEEDFLKQLGDPIQLRMERAPRKIEALFRETAEYKGVVLPSWKLVGVTPADTLRAMGIAEAEVSKIVKSFEEFHAAADEFDARQRNKN